jgi:hypothetical protein
MRKSKHTANAQDFKFGASLKINLKILVWKAYRATGISGFGYLF